MKVVINTCYGGFSLSDEAIEAYLNVKGTKFYKEFNTRYNMTYFWLEPLTVRPSIRSMFIEYALERNDPDLIRIVESMGERANGNHAELKVVEIPDGVDWTIEEYDGMEHVAEAHRTWE